MIISHSTGTAEYKKRKSMDILFKTLNYITEDSINEKEIFASVLHS